LGQLAESQDHEIDIVLSGEMYDPTFVEMIWKSSQEMEAGKIRVFTIEVFQDFVLLS